MYIHLTGYPFKSMTRFSSGHRQIFVSTGLLCLFVCTLLQGNPAQSSEGQSASGAQAQTPPATAAPSPAKSAASGAGNAGGAPVSSTDYKVGPSDVLMIRVWGEPEFSGPVAVHQDGKFTLPLVGDLEAGGKTPVEIQDIIAAALKKMVVKPLVTVTVQDVGSKKYYLVGQVAHAGEYPLVVPTTVLEAIDKSGGLSDFANTKKIYILRGNKRIPFNYKDVHKGKNMDQNILLEPGDHVYVP
jgi:polysaccharide export outer membrane protein